MRSRIFVKLKALHMVATLIKFGVQLNELYKSYSMQLNEPTNLFNLIWFVIM